MIWLAAAIIAWTAGGAPAGAVAVPSALIVALRHGAAGQGGGDHLAQHARLGVGHDAVGRQQLMGGLELIDVGLGARAEVAVDARRDSRRRSGSPGARGRRGRACPASGCARRDAASRRPGRRAPAPCCWRPSDRRSCAVACLVWSSVFVFVVTRRRAEAAAAGDGVGLRSPPRPCRRRRGRAPDGCRRSTVDDDPPGVDAVGGVGIARPRGAGERRARPMPRPAMTARVPPAAERQHDELGTRRTLLFRVPSGLADGLALKELRYAGVPAIRPWDRGPNRVPRSLWLLDASAIRLG